MIIKVTPKDPKDEDAAELATRLLKHMMDSKLGDEIREKVEKAWLDRIIYGEGFVKTVWEDDK